MLESLALIAHLVGITPSLLLAICFTESNFRNVAGDNGKSIGICQIKLNTAKMLDKKVTETELWDPLLNGFYAAKYLKYQQDRYKGRKDAEYCIKSAYNAGSCIKSNRKYVDKVRLRLKIYRSYDKRYGH